MPLAQKEEELAMLRTEIEMLVDERTNLLRIAGAAAVFIANTNLQQLPKQAVDAADVLATLVNGLSEDTLKEALEAVNAEVAVDTYERRKEPKQ